jgi:hypothetical protein
MSDWVDSLIGPGGLLLLVSYGFMGPSLHGNSGPILYDTKGQMARKVVEQHLLSLLLFCGYKISHFLAKFFRKKLLVTQNSMIF